MPSDKPTNTSSGSGTSAAGVSLADDKRDPAATAKRRRGPGRRFQKGQVANPKGRPPGPNKATIEIKELARRLTAESPAWVKATAARLKAGKEAPAVVQTLLHYGYGKPRETVQIEGSESLAELLRVALGKPQDPPQGTTEG